MSDSQSDSDLADIRAQKRSELKQKLTEDTEDTEDTGDDTTNNEATTAKTPTDPIHITSADEFNAAVTEHDVVLVDFYADWCGPCQMLEPTVKSLAAETAATVLKVDIDQHQSLAQQYQVRGVPTLLLFNDAETVEQIVGVRDESTLRSLIQQYTQ
ncbi:thioredoxin [Haloquadratum walsbyi]|jgi:thioredoxin 1|uniref:Thioredoxin n=1 Tax=Haloquadratum walsbyi (strain DSM 16790 / HBSQ001) TaxID=362976 RepID=Q18JP7_HALWD|nr:thioredoxin [Haloquadratum walsbyi]CAJ51757.1 thioredoxin [Haloquadratum walsbyi DSM 16790]